MKKETYQRIFDNIESISGGAMLLSLVGKLLTYTTAIAYFGIVAGLFLEKNWCECFILIGVPAISFVLVSVFRKGYNAKRPYEVYDFKPLIPKETKGKSFPSRHVFSIFVIGSSVFWFHAYMGAIICMLGCGLAVIRVISGVHFPKDVAAGAVIGILFGGIVKVLLSF